jgi:5-methylcytosine-specific restriction endonuclease McrA
MSKLPFMQFYANDWVADTQALSLAARGAWISLLCAMWNSQNRGVLSLPIVGYSRILGASVEQTEHVLSELSDMHICDSVEDGGVITLISRRMVNEERQRKSGATRQARLREKGGGDPERWAAIRVPILIRDEYMCAYCGRKADTVDHVIPKSKGGTEEKTNLVACCKRCNSVKNNRTLEASGLSFWHGFDQSHLSNAGYIIYQKSEARG